MTNAKTLDRLSLDYEFSDVVAQVVDLGLSPTWDRCRSGYRCRLWSDATDEATDEDAPSIVVGRGEARHEGEALRRALREYLESVTEYHRALEAHERG